MTLTRTALQTIVAGDTARNFVRRLCCLHVEGVDVGEKYHTKHFINEVSHLACRAMQSRDALDLDAVLPGLGIPSNFAVLFDGVPIGGVSAYGRHGNAMVICLASVGHRSGRLHGRFVAWATCRAGHSGPTVADEVLVALAAPPISLSRAALRKRMSLVGGDGAVVRGGPDRRLPGTQAADILWFEIHPRRPSDDEPLAALAEVANPAAVRGRERHTLPGQAWTADPSRLHAATEWDKFHREDLALTRAIARSGRAQEVYEVCALMDMLFGLGDGRLLLRNAAAAVDITPLTARLPGLTRKVWSGVGQANMRKGQFEFLQSPLPQKLSRIFLLSWPKPPETHLARFIVQSST